MAISSINSYSRLSDRMERELMQAAYSVNRAYSIAAGLSAASKWMGRTTAAAGRKVLQFAILVNEARARDAQRQGRQW